MYHFIPHVGCYCVLVILKGTQIKTEANNERYLVRTNSMSIYLLFSEVLLETLCGSNGFISTHNIWTIIEMINFPVFFHEHGIRKSNKVHGLDTWVPVKVKHTAWLENDTNGIYCPSGFSGLKQKSFLWDQCYPCFLLLMTSPLGFKPCSHLAEVHMLHVPWNSDLVQ